jgi:hypothetical protein
MRGGTHRVADPVRPSKLRHRYLARRFHPESDRATDEAAPFEARASRQGRRPRAAQRAFVARVVRDLDVFGEARFILADGPRAREDGPARNGR